MIKLEINLYKFEELTDRAKERAIMDHRIFILNDMQPTDFISGDPEYDTPEELEKAYREQFDYLNENDEPIIESIEINDYLFYYNGETAHTTHYCGQHPLAGEIRVTLHGEAYFTREEQTNA